MQALLRRSLLTNTTIDASSKDRTTKGYSILYPQLVIRGDQQRRSGEALDACRKLQEALALREKYQSWQALAGGEGESAATIHSFSLEHGVFRLKNAEGAYVDRVIPMSDFYRDYARVLDIASDGPVRTFTYERLKVLELKFDMHRNLNSSLELESTKEDIRDFQNVYKVDTHVHLAAAMTASQLLDFIKAKLDSEGDLVVNETKDKGEETLKQMFERLKLDVGALTTDSLDVHGDNTFQRFDNFNNKYNPFGFADLRLVFLKSANKIQGRYFAELTKDLLVNRPPFVASEYRISIYGRSAKEWDELAEWCNSYDLKSATNQWMIQVPRIFSVWNRHAGVASFEAMLANIFRPLFEVSLDPSSHPALHIFLNEVSGFDSVDDESKLELAGESWPSPEEWCTPQDPPYSYYMYYFWANLSSLNALRASKGLNTFSSRPHCGESGDVNHLASAFLTAQHINHGINLAQSTPLQYLYYLARIGLAVSPLSNNALFLDYRKNPFDLFFRRGLFVSLSTDDPLQFHYTQNPLIEEYAVATQNWKFNPIDLSELARNSVLMSGFSHETKKKWIGPTYDQPGPDGNDISFTNVPNIRVSFRQEAYNAEMELIGHSSPMLDSLTLSSSVFDNLGWTCLEIANPGDVPINVTTEGIQAVYRLQTAHVLRRKYTAADNPIHPNPSLLYSATPSPLTASSSPVPACGAATATVESTTSASSDSAGASFTYAYVAGVILPTDLERLARLRSLPSSSECQPNILKVGDDVRASLIATDDGLRGDDAPIFREAERYQKIHSFADFVADYQQLCTIVEDGPTRTWTYRRLKLFEFFYRFHSLMNKSSEKKQAKRIHTDFYQCHKVDTHVHVSSAPHPEHFLVFLKDLWRQKRDQPVAPGQAETIAQLFQRLKIPIENLTVDALGMSSIPDTFSRFDTFQNLHNPFGSKEMRDIFLKTDNDNQGEYFGALLSQVMDVAGTSPQIHTEYRLSINGKSLTEWHDVAVWAKKHRLIRPSQNRWVIQVPRKYDIYFKEGQVTSFGQLLRNIFEPLFAITADPTADPDLVEFLDNVSGFDSVHDESALDRPLEGSPAPDEWTSGDNPPYAYYLYYMWANIASLNNCRRATSQSIFDFRPHSGAAGDPRHLCAAFLLGQGISHGIKLKSMPALQYLFYVAQIPIYCSPISENGLYIKMAKHPFVSFFRRGLSISLCSDNPLQHHFTEEPLLEEFAIAAQLHSLSPIDMTELARNSVLHSGFPDELKEQWLGHNFRTGNTPSKSNLPPIRHAFRQYVLQTEKRFIRSILQFYTAEGQPKKELVLLNPVLQALLHSRERRPETHSPPNSAVSAHWSLVSARLLHRTSPRRPVTLR